MEKIKDSQFTLRYNKVMFITFLVVISILVALSAIQIDSQTEKDDVQLVERVKDRSVSIDNLIVSITDHLNLIQTRAENFFLDSYQIDNSKLFRALSSIDDNYYSLDNIPSPYLQRNIGNLTGMGNPANFSPSLKAELAMALGLNSLFQAAKDNIPNAAWVYYISKNYFINIYPWEHSDQNKFTERAYKQIFYNWGTPAVNSSKKIYWTPAYIDDFGKGIMVTAAKPIYRDEEFLGIVAIDITLKELTTYVKYFKGKSGTLMIVNEQNQMIAHPTLALSESDTLLTLKHVLPESLQSAVDSFFKKKPLQIARKKGYSYTWYEMKNAPWRIIFILYEKNIFIRIISMIEIVFFILLVALIVMLCTTRKITLHEFIYPAESLVRHIAKESGNIASPVPDHVPEPWVFWFTEVSRIFKENRLLIEEIIETTASNERMESELNLAREIQLGTLPTNFPFEPEVYAYLVPAREVGGDLYDFFFIDNNHLCFTVGDVAGKGVPAALFMVIAKKLISNNAHLGGAHLSPANIMTQINEMLYRDNPNATFVTLFIGILNVQTGVLRYSNGGHVPPIFSSCDNDPCYKKELSGPVVGVIPGIIYKDISISLQSGEAIFLCTDGVTEAMNEDDKLFGDKRLLDDFIRLKDSSCKEVVDGILQEVRHHAGTTPQSDDIAMMMIRWCSEIEIKDICS
ncbi:MAG: SpoIIE family protein phosphatase [Candidatus Electrothrix sp.]